MTTFVSRRDGQSGPQDSPTANRVGHVYLDTHRWVLYCLNPRARDLIREGVPLTGAAPEPQTLRTLDGEVVLADDLPLVRAWRVRLPQEITLAWHRPGLPVQHLTWNAAPCLTADGQVAGVLATVIVGPPALDWEVLAGLAHDLRTPLQTLRLVVPLLEELIPPEGEARQFLDRLKSGTDRALSVGLDLLEWCRGPVQGGRAVQWAWFALEPFLTSLAAEQTLVAQRKGIALRTHLDAVRGVEVHSDPVRLGRLLINLLANAVRYTPAGGVRLAADWRQEPGGERILFLSVMDTGAGISQEDQESIFQPFEQGKAGRESDSGSGLGLAVVDRLVRELKLAIEVFSHPGQGSTFQLLIPASVLREAGQPLPG